MTNYTWSRVSCKKWLAFPTVIFLQCTKTTRPCLPCEVVLCHALVTETQFFSWFDIWRMNNYKSKTFASITHENYFLNRPCICLKVGVHDALASHSLGLIIWGTQTKLCSFMNIEQPPPSQQSNNIYNKSFLREKKATTKNC